MEEKRVESMLEMLFETFKRQNKEDIKKETANVINSNIEFIEKRHPSDPRVELLKHALEIIDEEYDKFVAEAEKKDKIKADYNQLMSAIRKSRDNQEQDFINQENINNIIEKYYPEGEER